MGSTISQPGLSLEHLKLDNDSLKSYHVPDIKVFSDIKSLFIKDLSSLGGKQYGEDYRN